MTDLFCGEPTLGPLTCVREYVDFSNIHPLPLGVG
jgi:hypothetical protein